LETAEPFPWDDTKGQTDKKTCAMPKVGEGVKITDMEDSTLYVQLRALPDLRIMSMMLANVGAKVESGRT
jgi:hypothetical protein